jgi:hypothetical protein
MGEERRPAGSHKGGRRVKASATTPAIEGRRFSKMIATPHAVCYKHSKERGSYRPHDYRMEEDMATTLRLFALLILIALVGMLAIGWIRPTGPIPGNLAGAAGAPKSEVPFETRNLLEKRLPFYGEDNWIVIADAAYPYYSRRGVETVVTDADQFKVVKYVLDRLEKTKHLRPIICLADELALVTEKDAPGITNYRAKMKKLFGKQKPQSIRYAAQLEKFNDTNVLILKTKLALPYASVFLKLSCKYLRPEAARRVFKALYPAPPVTESR